MTGRTRTSAREEVLTRIRTALHGATPPGPVPRAYLRDAGVAPGSAQALDLLTERVQDYRATVHRVGSAAEVPARITAILAGRGARSAVVPPGLDRSWVSGVQVRVDDPPLPVDVLDGTDAVVTACAVAVAVTGTLVLDASPDQGRRAISLIPDLHVCVVRADQVVGSVPEALTRLEPTRPLTWISGPSATSDIELDRVEGVHGPRTLEVVLVG